MIAGLILESLGVERGGRTLFSNLDLKVEAGEAVALTGANGAGKTSLLRTIAGLIRPVAGTVRFEGASATLEPEDARSTGLHLLGHQDGLKTTRTAREELAFWSAWMGGDAAGIALAVDIFELAPLLDLDVRRLSAGQRRRLALARLAASPRPLWLLDEPMAPLDADRRARFGALMAAHVAGGGLILAAVHDPLPIPARSVVIGAPA